MRIVVNRDLCEGNARCVSVAPSVFQVDDQDELQLTTANPGEELREVVETAVALCPRQALSIVEA